MTSDNDSMDSSAVIPMALVNGPSNNDALPTAHFLRIPQELRNLIWGMMLQEIKGDADGRWYNKPAFEFGSLMLSCRQLYGELQASRPQKMVTLNNWATFYYSLEQDYKLGSILVMRRYRSICIQFDLNATRRNFRGLTVMLSVCSPILEELRLFFTGTDRYNNPIFVNGCAYCEGYDNKKLPVDGQRAPQMMSLQSTIQLMQRLRVLVISNMNHQIMPGMLRDKPRLQYLHLTADPRSEVHRSFDINRVASLLFFAKEYSPPLKVLHLAANTMLRAFALPSSCALTLEHLTWTIPDALLGSNRLNQPLFRDTVQLMADLLLNARNLKTLRICVHGPGSHSDRRQYQHLAEALTGRLAQLRCLREVEIHIPARITRNPRSQIFPGDILSSLPVNVERFYASDELIAPRELHKFVTEKYLSATVLGHVQHGQTVLAPPVNNHVRNPVEERLSRWHPSPPLAPPSVNCWSECSYTNHELVQQWIDNTTEEFIPYREDEPPTGGGAGNSGLFLSGIIGENFRRKDYIPVSPTSGNLKFITYEFRQPDYACRTERVGETLTQMVLRLNGRLLDRERNRHLSSQLGIDTIPPRMDEEAVRDLEAADRSEDEKYARMLRSIYEIEETEPRDKEQALEELMASPFADDERYFGREHNASVTFARESVAKPGTLPALTYPHIEDEKEDDSQCHWLCPDYRVPTLAEIDKQR